MGTTTEEVQINYTSDASDYIRETEGAYGATENLAQSVGQTAANAGVLGLTFLKLNSIMQTLGVTSALGLDKWKAFNITIGSITKSIYRQIPAWIKLRTVIAASGIGLLVLALAGVIAAVQSMITGFDGLSTAMRTIGNIVKGLITVLTGFGKVLIGIISLDQQLILEGVEQAWKGISEQIGNAAKNARAMSRALEEMSKYELATPERTAELQIQTRQLERQLDLLKESGGSLREQESLIKQITQLRKDLLLEQQAGLQIQAAVAFLETQTESSESKRLEAQVEFNKLKAQILLIDQDILELSQQQADLIKDLYDVELIDPRIQREIDFQKALKDSMDAIDAYAERRQSALDEADRNAIWGLPSEEEVDAAMAPLIKRNNEFRRNQKKAADAQKKQDADALKADEIITEQKAQNQQDLFNLGMTLAGENQAAQGALMIAQAIANTALAITKVTGQTGVFAPAVIPSIIASGAIQVATIAAQLGVSASGSASDSTNIPDISTREQDVRQGERVGGELNRQVVLYKEDVDRVNNRVNYSEDRAQI